MRQQAVRRAAPDTRATAPVHIAGRKAKDRTNGPSRRATSRNPAGRHDFNGTKTAISHTSQLLSRVDDGANNYVCNSSTPGLSGYIYRRDKETVRITETFALDYCDGTPDTTVQEQRTATVRPCFKQHLPALWCATGQVYVSDAYCS